MSHVLLEEKEEKRVPLSGSKALISSIEPILQLQQLNIYVQQGKEWHTLIHDLSLSIRRGETLALVGESGSGKSVTGSAVLGLLPNSLHVGGGQILFQGGDILPLPEQMRRKLRGKQISCVFQDYQGGFTPFLKLGAQLVETIRCHEKLSNQEATLIALKWIEQVGLPAERVFNSYPFQLSGGQQQRVALAAAMMLKPALLIADEPTTALDVLTGERILDLLVMLQQQTHCAVLLISHDLRHVLKRANTIAVMRHGEIVEIGAAEKIKSQASHPYTQMLLKARPSLSEINVKGNGDVAATQTTQLAMSGEERFA
ncbi:ATP-binding cassette domain-containing protein [Pelosinus baikalensis]|uniref:ABC transporter ATP-binding protein n=1 Tax=Pelosinus baikalensis TaxID=2892015 RepID=A0ABS8HY13_9FIRM|nr:ABC transporter ATP-binding protein [Pelosinus baikalensis]MCC5468030.1 ABC transporter ATP-binding protein [Pelosinus baikalensis]